MAKSQKNAPKKAQPKSAAPKNKQVSSPTKQAMAKKIASSKPKSTIALKGPSSEPQKKLATAQTPYYVYPYSENQSIFSFTNVPMYVLGAGLIIAGTYLLVRIQYSHSATNNFSIGVLLLSAGVILPGVLSPYLRGVLFSSKDPSESSELSDQPRQDVPTSK